MNRRNFFKGLLAGVLLAAGNSTGLGKVLLAPIEPKKLAIPFDPLAHITNVFARELQRELDAQIMLDLKKYSNHE